MASVTGRSGKCSNFGNCSIADARTTVEVPSGLDLVCNECGKPLLTTGTGIEGGRSKVPVILGVLLVVAFLVSGAIWFFFANTKGPDPAPPPKTAPPTAPPKIDSSQTKVPSKTVNGDCSAEDERAGLCKIVR